MPDPSEGEQQASVAPPGAEPAEAVAGGGGVAPPAVAPAPLDADDTRGAHLGGLLRSPVTLSLGAALVIACFVGGTLAAGALLGLRRRRRRRPARLPDRLRGRLERREGGLLQPLRERPRAEPDGRPDDAAADDAAAPQGRSPLRRAGHERHAPRRLAGGDRPLHLRDRDHRQRGRRRHRLLPLHRRPPRPARRSLRRSPTSTASAARASGSWTRPRTPSGGCSGSSSRARRSTSATRSSTEPATTRSG